MVWFCLFVELQRWRVCNHRGLPHLFFFLIVTLQLWDSCKITLTHGCLKVHGGVPILLCIFVDPLSSRINGLVFRECLIALFMNPEFWSSSHDSWFKCQQTKKRYNTRATHFTESAYLKQRQECMFSLIFKKLIFCSVMPASRDVNPVATSHTVEHLSSMFLHSWSYDKPILYLIYYCLNKNTHCLNPW